MRRNRVLLVLEGMRPKQWAKNVFVLAPLLFALRAGDAASALRAGVAFVLFCVASGVVYLLNDVADREADAHHPRKRLRPVASGSLPVRVAVCSAAGLGLLSLVAGVLMADEFGLTLSGYLALNLFYSFRGKQVPIADVLCISLGFVLRVVGGAVAIPVPISFWILLCTFLLSLYLGLGKRLHEVLLMGEDASRTRSVLRLYGLGPTRRAFQLTGIASGVAFLAYTLSERAFVNFGTRALVFTVPLVLAGLARFHFLAHDTGRKSSPTDSLLSDP
ncbi:MAG: decaprenyl-phosphate phosphoribosyltransferase, partial [Deltaproteobacteria bacterium]|nr:decaprenyl-phosphate phosphoribosyltransferase [Deltaproteobacteria bacterium]